MKRFSSNLFKLVKLTYQDWSKDNASRLAAALAYYTVFSLAPLLVLVILITGLLWQQDVVRSHIMTQIQGLVGPQGAGFISTVISHQGTRGQGIISTVAGIIALVLGALGVFQELQSSLDTIWNVEPKPTKGLMQSIRRIVVDRLLSFTMILGIGFLLLVSLVISTGITAVQGMIRNVLPVSPLAIEAVNLIISIGIITVLFALIFKLLPDAKIAWRDVWLGAFATAVLFAIGKTVIGIYLGNSNVASSYGAAGSLIIVLLWIYYSAQILFFGAELTQVYANSFESKIVPEAQALSTEPAAKPRSPVRREPARRGVTPVPVTSVGGDVEQENRQTVRFLLGIALASFVAGAVATFYGMRKR